MYKISVENGIVIDKQLLDAFYVPATIKNVRNYRDSVTCLTATLLNKHDEFAKIDCDSKDNYAVQIEQSCYLEACNIAKQQKMLDDSEQLTSVYELIIRRVISNIDKNINNNYLVKAILSAEVNPSAVGSMKSKELDPFANIGIYEEVEQRKNSKINKTYSNQYTCKRCKGNITTYFSKQIRGQDEGPTIFVKCETPNCEYTWHFRS